MHQRRSRRVIGASATGSALTSGPTPRQRRPVKAIAVTRPQLRARHSHREIKRQFCKIVGGVISPLLANVYLHYVFDLWAARWRRREATGTMIITRYADDLVIGFERQTDAHQFLAMMRKRFEGHRQFGRGLAG